MWSIMKLQIQVASELHQKSKQKTNPLNLRIQPGNAIFYSGFIRIQVELKICFDLESVSIRLGSLRWPLDYDIYWLSSNTLSSSRNALFI